MIMASGYKPSQIGAPSPCGGKSLQSLWQNVGQDAHLPKTVFESKQFHNLGSPAGGSGRQ